jgi:Dyp-type peroxidase family
MVAEAVTPVVAPGEADLADIQGLVYSAWNDHPYAAYLFARLGEDAARNRGWLADLVPRVTSAARTRRVPHGRVQLALAAGGVAALGAPAEVCSALPQELKDGMASRARILGDADPATWELGTSDVVVMVFARDASARQAMIDRERDALAAAGGHVVAEELTWPLDGKEHFGFADGLSQPFVPGAHERPRPGQDPVAAGEILLGYPNGYGKLPQGPRWGDDDLGRNGTYLVFRKLRQDVARFWSWLHARAEELAGGDRDAVLHLTDLLAAKLVGRWRSGAPIVLAPDHDVPELARAEHRNAFGYLELDPDGVRCPIASHIRRANPRDARGGTPDDSELVVSRHRIVRRGRSFGSPLHLVDARAGRDDGVPRGLYFICLQASIARGFEFIQQTWLSSPGFHGLFGEPDAITGNGDGTGHITIPADPLRLRLPNVPNVVRVTGGGYFFLPSLTALSRLCSSP